MNDLTFGGFDDPTRLDSAMALCERLANSQVVPRAYQGRPDDVFACAMYAAALGIGLMPALQGIAIIHGSARIWGDLMVNLCRRHPQFGGMTESIEIDDEVPEIKIGGKSIANYTARCTVRRIYDGQRAEEITESFSVGDAVRAGLWGKSGTWQTYPRRMLTWRARSWALRAVFPDALGGLSIAEEFVGEDSREVDANDRATVTDQSDVIARARAIAMGSQTVEVDELEPVETSGEA